MTDEPKNRINMEKGRQVYEQTRARLASNQALGKTTIRAVAKLLEDMHIEGRVGTFRLESDEPAVRGGTDLGPTPLQYFVAGAAFCLITQMARFAPLYDIPLEDVQADVRAEFNIADKFGMKGPNGAFEQVTYAVTLRSSAPPEQVRLLIEHADAPAMPPNPCASPSLSR
jgi:putative redox protein